MYNELIDAFNHARRIIPSKFKDKEIPCKHINPIDGRPILLNTVVYNSPLPDGEVYMCPICNTYASKSEVDRIKMKIVKNTICN